MMSPQRLFQCYSFLDFVNGLGDATTQIISGINQPKTTVADENSIEMSGWHHYKITALIFCVSHDG